MEKYIPFLILGGAAVAAVLALIGFALLRRRKLRRLGIDGEKQVARALKKYAGIRSFKVINDIYLPLYDKTTQIDHILIGFFGILVVETKNYAGAIYGDPKKKEWLHVVGDDRHSFYNPLMQNQAHIDCLRHWLGKENLYNMNIESVVVFTRKKAELYVPKGLPVIKLQRLGRFLHQPRFAKDSNYDVEKIYNAIMDHRVTDKKLIAEHNKNVKLMAKNNK